MNKQMEHEDVVLYEAKDGVATVTMNRPRYHNAQNSKMTYALDAAFKRARPGTLPAIRRHSD